MLVRDLFQTAFKNKLWVEVRDTIDYAVEVGDAMALEGIIQYLLLEDPMWLSNKIQDSFTTAAWLGHLPMVPLLVQHGASVNPDSVTFYNHLWTNMIRSPNKFEMLKLLISLGLDVNRVPIKGENYPIHLAALYWPPDVEFLEKLVSLGADTSLRGPYGQTAEDMAREDTRIYGGEYTKVWIFLMREACKKSAEKLKSILIQSGMKGSVWKPPSK